MLKKFEDLLPELDNLLTEFELIRDNLLAVEEAYTSGNNIMPNNSMTIPVLLLDEKCQKLNTLNDAFYEAMRECKIIRSEMK